MNSNNASSAVLESPAKSKDQTPKDDASKASTPAAPAKEETAAVIAPEPTKEEPAAVIAPEIIPQTIRLLGSTINCDEFAKIVSDAQSAAGRYKRIAESLNLGKKMQSINGKATLIVTPSQIGELRKMGKLGDNLAKSKQIVDTVNGLNMLAKSLVLLGIADFEID